MTENTCTFTPDSMTMNGQTFPAGYSVAPNGNVFVFVTVGEKQTRIKLTPDAPHYAAALAAARPEPDLPAEQPDEQEQTDEQAKRDPKQARGPVPEKDWIGTSIQGNGWKIEFCPIMERTRLIFDRIPTKEAREIVKAAGFAWSPKMGSWNKGLTWKAYRAAQKLAADLGGLARRAC